MTAPTAVEQFERPDPVLTNKIVTHLKSQGIFDQFRRECMADVDTKPAYHNLRQRVEGSVAAFLKMNPWRPDMNKNQLRDNLRKHIQSGGFLDIGVDRIVDQVVNPKIYTVFLPKVEEVVHNCLGRDKDKPVFEPPPTPEVKPEPPRFQNKHNLAPRARISTPLSGPRLPSIPNMEGLKPPEPPGYKERTGDGKDLLGSPEQEDAANRNYVVDEDDNEENAEDDEESPPFEPHSESDQLILGVRTDSSDSVSNDSQVVTTIVDDNLEERIDNSSTVVKEDSDKEIKKEDESSSDEYVPKTPTINMEGSDGTVIEFNSISEYKQYQTKYDEESLLNVEEEVVSSQWLDESSNPIKEERNIAEDESEDVSRKRKLNVDNFDEASSSSVDKGSTSDEGKYNTYINFAQKKIKVEEDDQEYETVSEFNIDENEDSNPEKSRDMVDFIIKGSDSEQRGKSRNDSDVYKDSGKSHHRHHGTKDYRSSSHQSTSSKDKSSEKEYRGSSSSSTYSIKDKKDHHKKDDKHSLSRDRNKDRERKKSESSTSKHSDRDKDREKNMDKRKEINTETEKEKESPEKRKKETRNEHRDKSRDPNDKEKRKHENHDKHSDGKQDHDSSHRHDKDKRDSSRSSKHSHSSSKHSHKSSSERHKSEKDQKLRQPSDKHTSHDKKSEKHDSKKKSREHCKPGNRNNEGRRSTDRDSNGPSGRSHSSNLSSSTSRSGTSRSHNETTSGTGDRTTSNSDNTVSDNVETFHDEDSKFDVISEPGIASPDPEPYEDSCSEHYISSGSDFYNSKGDLRESSFVEIEDRHEELANLCDVSHTLDESQPKLHESDKNEHCEVNSDMDKIDNITDDVLQNREENIFIDKDDMEENFTNPTCSVRDTSSEKENIGQAVNYKEVKNNIKESTNNVNNKEAKFKKPKIAANIFEVRKIMQARRNLKRMEKKRMKLLTNNNPDICTTEKTAVEKPSGDIFTGFESITCQKTEIYDCLIKRLSDDIDLLATKEETNPNLITSLIEINPELDEYIENVLKGKVHRKLRVRLPPICHEFYTFDSQQNAYILIKNRGDSPVQHKELVDNNLNNLENVSQNKEFLTSSEREHTTDRFNGTKPKSRLNSIHENSSSKSSEHNDTNESSEVFEEESDTPEKNLVTDVVSAEIGSKGMPNNIAPTPEAPTVHKIGGFVLTFNQTYDEILKDIEKPSLKVTETAQKGKQTPRTVVKITNSNKTEKVVMKPVLSTVQNKAQVPRITKSEPVNGISPKSIPERKLLPLISRIKKCNKESAPPSPTRPVNGIMSVDYNAKVEKNCKLSAQLINEVIGIHAAVNIDQGNQRSPLEEEGVDQRHMRDSRQVRVQQRYDNSDLYKPRLQLSRRGRSQTSPDAASTSPAVITRKRRAAVTVEESSLRPKRKR